MEYQKGDLLETEDGEEVYLVTSDFQFVQVCGPNVGYIYEPFTMGKIPSSMRKSKYFLECN